MKPQRIMFKMFLRQIKGDGMLIAVCVAPVLAACFFRFGIPYIEQLLCGYYGRNSIIADYYLLFDLFLTLITPYLFCFVSAMVMLTERDENMTCYMAVTPVGKKGYLISRLVYPAAVSFIVSLFLMKWFSLTNWQLPVIIITCLFNCVLSVAASLFVFSYSHNRVEGMAMAKLSGLIMLGLPVPFFIASGTQYLFSALPSFWIAKFCAERYYPYLFPAIAVSVLLIFLLYKKFIRKLV
ncbi:hypothetical protein EOM82_08565 [bacterium]|nr:hypothetical protein [bacterium]